MKQVIYSEHHRGIVEYPLMEKPLGISFNQEIAIKEWEAYNKWLSEPPIAQVRDEDIEFFSVPRGESEYEIKKCKCKIGEDCIYEKGKWFTTCLVAIPIKEADLEPGVLPTNEADVASHSVYGNKFIEQIKAEMKDADKEMKKESFGNENYIYYLGKWNGLDTALKILLNSDKNVQASVATEADSSNPV